MVTVYLCPTGDMCSIVDMYSTVDICSTEQRCSTVHLRSTIDCICSLLLIEHGTDFMLYGLMSIYCYKTLCGLLSYPTLYTFDVHCIFHEGA